MGMGPIKCMLGFPTIQSSPLVARLECHATMMDASYRGSQQEWLTSLCSLHDAVDAAVAGDSASSRHRLLAGQGQLARCNEQLTALGQALIALRNDLFDREADAAEPLLAREPLFATLDYDGLYREHAGQGAVLPHRAFWDEAAARVRNGGARGGCRLLERHLRELQSHLQIFIANVDVAARLPLRVMAETLHGASLAIARVMTGYTRLITTFGYVSLFCERATQAHEQAASRVNEMRSLAAS